MNKEIKCPHCNESLIGRDKMYRTVKVESNDWFGIENGEIVYCNQAPDQPDFGILMCVNCGEYIEEYIESLLDEEVIEGEL
jgi:predicted RNA-binding Zn-ribbon protein involved in translation (DUF1610 family)